MTEPGSPLSRAPIPFPILSPRYPAGLRRLQIPRIVLSPVTTPPLRLPRDFLPHSGTLTPMLRRHLVGEGYVKRRFARSLFSPRLRSTSNDAVVFSWVALNADSRDRYLVVGHM